MTFRTDFSRETKIVKNCIIGPEGNTRRGTKDRGRRWLTVAGARFWI